MLGVTEKELHGCKSYKQSGKFLPGIYLLASHSDQSFWQKIKTQKKHTFSNKLKKKGIQNREAIFKDLGTQQG